MSIVAGSPYGLSAATGSSAGEAPSLSAIGKSWTFTATRSTASPRHPAARPVRGTGPGRVSSRSPCRRSGMSARDTGRTAPWTRAEPSPIGAPWSACAICALGFSACSPKGSKPVTRSVLASFLPRKRIVRQVTGPTVAWRSAACKGTAEQRMDDHLQGHPETAARHARATRIGVDVGGTFTDLVALGRRRAASPRRCRRRRGDQSAGVIAAVDAARAWRERRRRRVRARHDGGDERAARAARRPHRAGHHRGLPRRARDRPPGPAGLYDLTPDRPPPLVPRELRFDGRASGSGPTGVARPLDERRAGGRGRGGRATPSVEAVAVCLLFALPAPRRTSARSARRCATRCPACTSRSRARCCREFREYERFATTVADAYLAPAARPATSSGSASALGAPACPAPLVMQSSGGVVDLDSRGRRAPPRCVLSGPAGGVVGAALRGRARAATPTCSRSTWAAPAPTSRRSSAARPQTTTESVVAGVPIKLPGGRHPHRERGRRLDRLGRRRRRAARRAALGRRRAGAGGATGSGGDEPTVTDAEPGARLPRATARRSAARSRSTPRAGRAGDRPASAAQLGLDPSRPRCGDRARRGRRDGARAAVVIRSSAGIDPRDFALVAFGGAGGDARLRAGRGARRSRRSSCRAPAGVLSARSGSRSPTLRRDYVRAAARRAAVDWPRPARGGLRGARASERARTSPARDLRRLADLRYGGQSFELTVPAADASAQLAAAFADAHEQRYGYRSRRRAVEIVNVRVVATIAAAQPVAARAPPTAPAERRAPPGALRRRVARHAGLPARRSSAPARRRGPGDRGVRRGHLRRPPGWAGRVDDAGTLVLER